MAGVPNDLHKALQDVFLTCDPFGTDKGVADLFVVGRLYPWRHAISHADNPQARATAVIAKLHDKRNTDGQNALALLVEVLQEQTDSETELYQQLGELLVRLDTWGAKGSRGAFLAGQPSQTTAPTPATPQPVTNVHNEAKDGRNFVQAGGNVTYNIYSSHPAPPPIVTPKPVVTPQHELASIAPSSGTGWVLVIKGGGAKGLAYVGALEELDKHYTFDHYIGTSAGSIAAVLLAAGYSTAELKKLLEKQDFTHFLDANFWQGLSNGWSKGGMYEAESFNQWLEDLLHAKIDAPPAAMKLNQLPKGKRVTIYASQKDKRALIFDSAHPETANLPIAYAVRCSISIPYLFVPQSHGGDRVYDGGMQNNYPIGTLFEKSPELKQRFIGLYLGDEGFKWKKKQITQDLLDILTEGNDKANLVDYYDQTIIINPDPISTLDFNLNQPQKDFLVAAGSASARRFLAKKGRIELLPEKIEQLKGEIEKQRADLQSQLGWSHTLTNYKWYLTLGWVMVVNSFATRTLFIALLFMALVIAVYSGLLTSTTSP